MAASGLTHATNKLCIFYFIYILLRGAMPTETSLGPQNISNVLFVGKLLSENQIKASKRPSKVKPTWNPMSMRLTKICQILQYYLLASLVLLAGDVSPNPGWALPVLNQHGLKIAHLNVRSLSQHWDEFQTTRLMSCA